MEVQKLSMIQKVGKYIFNDERAFTLYELILVLTIISSFTFIFLPELSKSYKQLKLQSFIHQLYSDVLYLQNNQYNNLSYQFINFDQNAYYIKIVENSKSKMIKRNYPEGLRLYSSKPRIEFNVVGNIKQPQTLTLFYGEEHYELVFPFGKGRFYVK